MSRFGNHEQLEGWMVDSNGSEISMMIPRVEGEIDQTTGPGRQVVSPEKATQTIPAMVSGRASSRELPSQVPRAGLAAAIVDDEKPAWGLGRIGCKAFRQGAWATR